MGRPREHDDTTRHALLRVAGELLWREGVGALTNRRLALEANTTTRAIYSLFGSKHGILRELFLDSARAMGRALEAVPEHTDPLEELLELALAYRHAAIEHPHAYRLQFEGSPEFQPDEQDRRVTRQNFQRVLRTIRRCVDAGIFPGRRAETIALQTWATIHGLASLEIHGHLFPPERAEARWRDHVAAMLEGYRTGP